MVGPVNEVIAHQAELPKTGWYGSWGESFDRYPGERRWAKRAALYRLRGLISSFTKKYDKVTVRDMRIIEHEATFICCELCGKDAVYTWGWKCTFLLEMKKDDE